MARARLLERVRHEVRNVLAGYVQSPELDGNLDGYIVSPALGDRAGVLGALALGQAARAPR